MPRYKITDPATGNVYNTTANSPEEAKAKIEAHIAANPQPAGGGGAPAEEPGLLTRAMNAMEASGKATREAVMNPAQSIPDILRSTGDFVSMGLTDRLRSAVYGTPYEQENAETEAAGARSGSIDDALNVGSLLMQPSAASKYAPQATNALVRGGEKALAHGAEGAAQSGVNAVIEGNDPLEAMAYGGFGGAGGSIGADAVGSVANVFTKNKPKYKNDDAFFKDADSARINSDLGKRRVRLERIRMGEATGDFSGAASEVNALDRASRKTAGIPREEVEGLNALANRRDYGAGLRELGNLIQGATPAGKWAMGAKTGFVAPVVGGAVKMAGSAASRGLKKDIEALKLAPRNAGEKAPPNLSPERIEELRNLLARSGTFGGRNRDR